MPKVNSNRDRKRLGQPPMVVNAKSVFLLAVLAGKPKKKKGKRA